MNKQTVFGVLCLVSVLGVIGCGGGANQPAGGTGGSVGEGGAQGAAGSNGSGGMGGASGGQAGTNGVATPPVPIAAAGHIAVVVRDQGKDTAFDCMAGGAGVMANFWPSPTTSVLMMLCFSGDAQMKRIFGLTVTSTVPFVVGSTAVASAATATTTTQPSVSVIDAGEGISAANFNGDGGVSFQGTLTFTAIGAATGDLVSGSFVASWTHIPSVTGNVTTKVAERPGAVAVSFSFARS